MEEDQKPFPTRMFVNEAFHFLNTKAMEPSVTKEERNQKDLYQIGDFRFQNTTQGVNTVEWELGNSWSGNSNEDIVDLQNIKNEREFELVNGPKKMKCESEIQVDTDSLLCNDAVNIEMKVESIEEECFVTDNSTQIKCEREITQIDSDSLVSNDAVNIEMKIESIKEESFVTNNSDNIEVEIDACDDSESNVLFPMESEKDQNQAAYSEIKLKRDEEEGVIFNSPGHTTNRDGDEVIHQDMSTELHSIIQENLKDCRVFIGPGIDEVITDLFENNEIRMPSTSALKDDKRIWSERKDKLNHTMRIQPGYETEKFSYYTCTVCEKTFTNKSELQIHMRHHIGQKAYQDTICGSGKAYIQSSNITKLIKNHGKESYTCTVCDKTFPTNSTLARHTRLHTRDKPFKCTVCDKAFTENSALTTHMRIHTGERPFKCTVCDKSFAHSSNLTNHMKHHQRENTVMSFKCTVCDKTFPTNSTLSRHMRLHTGEKPFKCTVCDKACTQNSDLTQHMRIHTGEKPFKCTVCDKSFAHSSNLRKHMRHHLRETPFRSFKCTVCDKACIQNSDLTIHMRVHTGEKPFKCTVCDKAFTHSSNFTRHMKIHTGEKLFKCTVCGKAFTYSSNLTRHMKIHTGEKPVE